MIYEWLCNLNFVWANNLPGVYDVLLKILFIYILVIGLILDILLFPVELIIWIKIRKGCDKNE